MEQDEFNSLSEAEQLRLINEQKEGIRSRMHLLDAFLDSMLKATKKELTGQEAEDTYDRIDVLSALHAANSAAIPGGSADLLLAAAVLRLAELEIENEKQPANVSRIATDDGEAIILASLNIDTENYRVSSDVMRVWSQLYSVLFSAIPGMLVSQEQADGILFLVAEPKKKPGMFDKTVTVVSGKNAEELDDLLKKEDVPNEVRDIVAGMFDALKDHEGKNIVDIPEARQPEHDQ